MSVGAGKASDVVTIPESGVYELGAGVTDPDLVELRRLAEELGRVPRMTDSPRARTLARRFGSWRDALVLAGLTPPPAPRRPQWTRESVLEAIARLEAETGRRARALDFQPAQAERKGDVDAARRFRAGVYPHIGTIERLFGRFSAALLALAVSRETPLE